MSRITLAGRSSIPTTDLDANFSEIYAALGPSGINQSLQIGARVAYSISDTFTYGASTFANYGVTFGVTPSGFGGPVLGLSGYNGVLVFTSGAIRMRYELGGGVSPGADNAQNLGSSSLRWATIYAGTGTINTSDAREKTPVQPLTDPEIAAAKQLAGEIGGFRFLDAVASKGDGARLHIGMTVQRAMEVMQAHGLDPMAYGFICHDTWAAEDDRPAGDRYGFRADELMLFLARGFDARLQALEARA